MTHKYFPLIVGTVVLGMPCLAATARAAGRADTPAAQQLQALQKTQADAAAKLAEHPEPGLGSLNEVQKKLEDAQSAARKLQGEFDRLQKDKQTLQENNQRISELDERITHANDVIGNLQGEQREAWDRHNEAIKKRDAAQKQYDKALENNEETTALSDKISAWQRLADDTANDAFKDHPEDRDEAVRHSQYIKDKKAQQRANQQISPDGTQGIDDQIADKQAELTQQQQDAASRRADFDQVKKHEEARQAKADADKAVEEAKQAQAAADKAVTDAGNAMGETDKFERDKQQADTHDRNQTTVDVHQFGKDSDPSAAQDRKLLDAWAARQTNAQMLDTLLDWRERLLQQKENLEKFDAQGFSDVQSRLQELNGAIDGIETEMRKAKNDAEYQDGIWKDLLDKDPTKWDRTPFDPLKAWPIRDLPEGVKTLEQELEQIDDPMPVDSSGPGKGTGTGTGTDPDPGTGTGTDPDPGTGTGTDPDPGTGTGTDPDPGTGTGTGPDPGTGTGTDPDPGTGTGTVPDPGTGTGTETGTPPQGPTTISQPGTPPVIDDPVTAPPARRRSKGFRQVTPPRTGGPANLPGTGRGRGTGRSNPPVRTPPIRQRTGTVTGPVRTPRPPVTPPGTVRGTPPVKPVSSGTFCLCYQTANSSFPGSLYVMDSPANGGSTSTLPGRYASAREATAALLKLVEPGSVTRQDGGPMGGTYYARYKGQKVIISVGMPDEGLLAGAVQGRGAPTNNGKQTRPPVPSGPKPPVVHGPKPKPPVVNGPRPKPPVINRRRPKPPVVHHPKPPVVKPKPPVVNGPKPKPPVVHGPTPRPPVVHHPKPAVTRPSTLESFRRRAQPVRPMARPAAKRPAQPVRPVARPPAKRPAQPVRPVARPAAKRPVQPARPVARPAAKRPVQPVKPLAHQPAKAPVVKRS